MRTDRVCDMLCNCTGLAILYCMCVLHKLVRCDQAAICVYMFVSDVPCIVSKMHEDSWLNDSVHDVSKFVLIYSLYVMQSAS